VTAEFRHISLANIEVPESHREVDQDVVRNLAASIDKLRLLQPVTVRKVTRARIGLARWLPAVTV
jgi:ParB-like chromosome segregation protein Spo0J